MKYAIILAGGKGRRLWPVSRKNLPKQFIDFFGCGKTLLQQTYERMQKIMPKENILVVSHTTFEDILHEQLPELPHDNLILEPINRNTAPATLMALRSGIIPDDGDVIIVPADQVVMNEDKFKDAINNATDYIDCFDHVLTMGVKPTRPEPGYGYLQRTAACSKAQTSRKAGHTDRRFPAAPFWHQRQTLDRGACRQL